MGVVWCLCQTLAGQGDQCHKLSEQVGILVHVVNGSWKA